MSSLSDDNWLIQYYNRIQNECSLSFERRDRLTRLSYTILGIGIGLYIGLFAGDGYVTPIGRFVLVSGIMFILIRFFFQSMIAYKFYIKWRYFRTAIESYWMFNKPSLDRIKNDVCTYDHGKAMPETGRNSLTAQIYSGFILIIAVPIIPLAIELYVDQLFYYYVIIAAMIGYVLFEVHAFYNYDQIQPPK